MRLLSDVIDGETITITNLSSNARMWSALRGERPSFYGLNMGLCLPFAVGVAIAFPKRRVVAIDGDGSLIIETSSLITAADVRPAINRSGVRQRRLQRHGRNGNGTTHDLAKMAEGAGIAHTATLRTMEEYERPCARRLQRWNFASSSPRLSATIPCLSPATTSSVPSAA
jgi:thiamine pyrophosphate-dependent acetolactate synthase large subunit-like protein